jgi:hypothetical protein
MNPSKPGGRYNSPGLLPVILLFLAAATFSCHSGTQKPPAVKTPIAEDTLWKDDSTRYVELLNKKMDSAARINFLSQFCINKLKAHPNESQFDTAVLIDGFNGLIRFYKDAFSSGSRTNALAYIYDSDECPVLLFIKEKDWVFRQVIYAHGKLEDSAIRFFDYNFDGKKDLVIHWNYSAGRCSCGSNDCWRVYFYKEGPDSLFLCKGIDGYLDYGISEKEKAIYLGEHCEGYFGKYKWQGDQLVKTEAFLADSWYIYAEQPWTMEHVLYKKNGSVSLGKKRNGEIPASWKKAFGWYTAK